MVANPSAVWKSMHLNYSFYLVGEMGDMAMLHLNWRSFSLLKSLFEINLNQKKQEIICQEIRCFTNKCNYNRLTICCAMTHIQNNLELNKNHFGDQKG